MSAIYLPRVIQNETKKIENICSKMPLDGFVFDYHLYKKYKTPFKNIKTTITKTNKELIVMIDPRTDLFQADYQVRTERKSYESIFDLAGLPSDQEEFKPEDFKDKTEKIVKNFFKKTMITSLNGDVSFPKYSIIPYFCCKQSEDGWYKLTKEMIEYATKNYKTSLFATICIDESLLHNKKFLEKIIEDYKRFEVSGYVINILNFNEFYADEKSLFNLMMLVKELKKTNKKVMVYISEFGTILSRIGADFISCGICYMRSRRKPEILEGRSEIARIEEQLYIPEIFSKLYSIKLLRYISFVNSYNCNCPICKEYRKYSKDLEELVSSIDVYDMPVHYAYWKKKELSDNSSLEKLLGQIEEGIKTLKTYNEKFEKDSFPIEVKSEDEGEEKYTIYSYRIKYAFLEEWKKAIEKFLEI